MKRRDIVEYRTARQMGAIAKRLGVSFQILHRSGEDGIPMQKVEVEVITSGIEEMDAFDRAMTGATEADVLQPWYIPPEAYVANLELCKTLYALSEWNDQYFHWLVDLKNNTFTIIRELGRDGASVVIDPNDVYYPAYDLGYLLRKLGNHHIKLKRPYVDSEPINLWSCMALYDDGEVLPNGLVESANTPEDATCMLCCEMFKHGILRREEGQ